MTQRGDKGGKHLKKKWKTLLAALVLFSCVVSTIIFVGVLIVNGNETHVIIAGAIMVLSMIAEQRMKAARGTQAPRRHYRIVVRSSNNKYKEGEY